MMGFYSESGRIAPSSPLFPWKLSAVCKIRFNGLLAPLYTFTFYIPAIFNIRKALFVVFSKTLFPKTVDMPISSI